MSVSVRHYVLVFYLIKFNTTWMILPDNSQFKAITLVVINLQKLGAKHLLQL